MLQVGLWQVADSVPTKLAEARIDLENHLETWIERDPSLLQAGLAIVGRQAEACQDVEVAMRLA